MKKEVMSVLSVLAAGQNYFGLNGYEHTLEVMWVQDFSSSFESRKSQISQDLRDSIEELKYTFPHSKFGLGGFVDIPTGSYGYERSGDYCYLPRYHVSRYTHRVQQAFDNAIVRSGRDWPEAQLIAMLAAAKDESSKWSNADKTSNGYQIHKVMVLVTDSGYHQEGDRKTDNVKPNPGDGSYKNCKDFDYPSVEQVKQALDEAGILPIFLVTREVSPIYRNLVRLLGNKGAVGVIDGNDYKSVFFSTLKATLHFEKECEGDCECQGEDCCEDDDSCSQQAAAVVINLEQIPKSLRLVVEN